MTVQDMVYRFYKLLESVDPILVNSEHRPDTETVLAHLNKAQNTYVSQKYASAGGFKMKSAAFNIFYDDFKTIITEANVTSLSPLANTAHYGKTGALPTGYMHYLRSDSSVTRTDISDASSKQVETITLTGTSGTANITGTGGLTKVVTFTTSLGVTAATFYINNVAAYSAQGIDLTAVGNTIVFTAQVAGVGFTAPTFTNTGGNIAGTVQHGYSRLSYFPNQLGTFADITKIMTTATNKPIFNNPIILLHKDNFWVVTDSYTTVNSVNFLYVRQPKKMTVNAPLTDEVSTCELSEFMHEDVTTLGFQDYIATKNIPREKTLNVNKQ